MHNFSCSGGMVQFPQRARWDTLRRTYIFSSDAIHFCASRVPNLDAQFFMLRWVWCGFHKMHVGTRYVKLVFLHLVRFAGHVVHSFASRAQNADTLFFMLKCDRSGLHKKHTKTHYAELMCFASGVIYELRSAFLCIRGTKHRCTIFHPRLGPVWFPQKMPRETSCRTCVFASGAICKSSSAFRCVRGTKRQRTTFHARVGLVWFPQKMP
jgi:hypothetical protein